MSAVLPEAIVAEALTVEIVCPLNEIPSSPTKLSLAFALVSSVPFKIISPIKKSSGSLLIRAPFDVSVLSPPLSNLRRLPNSSLII